MPVEAFEPFDAVDKEINRDDIINIRNSVSGIIVSSALPISAKAEFSIIVDEKLTPLLFKREPGCLDDCANEIDTVLKTGLMKVPGLSPEQRHDLLQSIDLIVRGHEN